MYIRQVRIVIIAILASLTLSSCEVIRVITHEVNLEPQDTLLGQYKIDSDHVSLIFKVNHFGFSNYVGRFNNVDAELNYDSKNPEKSKLIVKIKTSSIDSDNQLIDSQLKSAAFFNSEKFPYATFVSKEISINGANTAKVSGELKVRDRKTLITLDVIFNGGGTNPLTQIETLGFSASGSFKRSNIGLNSWFPAVGDTVLIDIEAEFIKNRKK